MKQEIKSKVREINVYEINDGSAWVWVCPVRKRMYRKATAQKALDQIQKNNAVDCEGMNITAITWHCKTEEGERVARVLADCSNALAEASAI